MLHKGHDNRMHAFRHARHAWEDFEVIRKEFESYPGVSVEFEQKLHALSHHMRHALYRIGVEVDWGKPVPRARHS